MTLALRPVFVHPGSLTPPPGAATQTCSAPALALAPALAHPLARQIPPPLALQVPTYYGVYTGSN